MVTAVSIAQTGYFPRELPPPFGSVSFGTLVKNKRPSFPGDYSPKSPRDSLPITHNLARVGSLRRQLKVPNPVNFLKVAEQIEKDWAALMQHCLGSGISLSSPDISPVNLNGRAIGRKFGLDELPTQRARIRASSRYILSADISQFYPSVYTHSIPWALNTKATAKAAFAAKKTAGLAGDALDRQVRQGQGRQTIGIPIGPDTSLVIAETILTAIDKAAGFSPNSALRYMDDYELGFGSYADAEAALATLQGALSEYGLQLNPSKTRITDLPMEIETPGVAELRIFQFDHSTSRGQHYGLVRFFNRAFELSDLARHESILRYAVARLNGEKIMPPNWSLFQNLLLQCACVEPGTLPFVIDQLKYYYDHGMQADVGLLTRAFNSIIEEHGKRAHGSEVAWALWGSILFATKIELPSQTAILSMEDNVVALLALDASKQGLFNPPLMPVKWASLMTPQELWGENWLLAYEANAQGWLGGHGGDNVAAVPAFDWLRKEGVRFYDTNAKTTYVSKKSISRVPMGSFAGVSA